MASTFELIPAIDLRGGRVVRLRQGDFDRETVFDTDPGAVARRFAGGGSTAAARRRPRRGACRCADPAGGAQGDRRAGVGERRGSKRPAGSGPPRTSKRFSLAGAHRVVFGTAAIRDPALVAKARRCASARIVSRSRSTSAMAAPSVTRGRTERRGTPPDELRPPPGGRRRRVVRGHRDRPRRPPRWPGPRRFSSDSFASTEAASSPRAGSAASTTCSRSARSAGRARSSDGRSTTEASTWRRRSRPSARAEQSTAGVSGPRPPRRPSCAPRSPSRRRALGTSS